MAWNWRKYLIVLLITAGIFATAFLMSNRLNSRKVAVIENTRDKVAIDILSTETRFALLSASSCEHVVANADFENSLSEELSNLARRLKYIENQLGENNESVLTVKRQYSILQIKDYLLVQELLERCGEKIPTILYFHESDCDDCSKQSIILDEIRELYPKVRIYWLDRELSDPAMQTIVSIFKIKSAPSLVVQNELVTGFVDLESLTELLPKWAKTTSPPAAAKKK